MAQLDHCPCRTWLVGGLALLLRSIPPPLSAPELRSGFELPLHPHPHLLDLLRLLPLVRPRRRRLLRLGRPRT